MPTSVLQGPLERWYAEQARSLPWRQAEVTAWHVLVSEVMLQQTPVARVLSAYDAWVARWPTPRELAADSPGEAVRMWGRLGYPRRALRLHEAATVISTSYDGTVPATYPKLRELPGVGDYTAAAVAAFAYRQRTVVLDTNIRRVLARVFGGRAQQPRTITAGERRHAAAVLPDDGAAAARWTVALMELGATVCTARAPRCAACPVRDSCGWRRRGYPAAQVPARRPQAYVGTDRECRGRLLGVLRSTTSPRSRDSLDRVWQDTSQRERALRSLIDDGLVVEAGDGAFALPGQTHGD